MSTVNNGPQIVRSGLVLDLDASYMRSYSPNVYPNPTDLLGFNRMATQIQSCTVARDPSQTRQYGSIPMKMAVTGNDPYAGAYGSLSDNLASALSGQTWTISVWAKASVATTGELFIFGADTNGAIFTTPDYSAGTISITNSWQRFSFSYTFTNASTRYIQFRLDGTITGGSGITIWWDGLQVERASAATNFNPYYFGDTFWRDVSNNLNNGTLTAGPTYGTSNKGIIVFDYIDDAVTIAGTLGTPSTFTLSAWVRSSNISQAQNIFNANPPFFLRITSSTIRCAVYTGSWIFVNGNVTLSSNVWYNLVLTYDQNFVKGYINGVLDVNSAKTGAPVWGGAGSIRLGYTTGGEDAPSVTNIAVAQIYNRALSAAEISQNFQATKTRFGL